MATLQNARWGGAYPPPQFLRRGRCMRCAATLASEEETLTDLCGNCWDRPLRWTPAQMDALLWDVLEGGRKPPTLGERLWGRLRALWRGLR